MPNTNNNRTNSVSSQTDSKRGQCGESSRLNDQGKSPSHTSIAAPSRRLFLSGLGVVGSSVMGVGLARADPADQTDTNPIDGQNASKNSSDEEGGTVEPQYLSTYTSSFSPYTVGTYEDSILESRWEVITPTIATYHRFDVLVEAANVYQPEPVASNFSSNDVEKNFVYEYDTALGVPAYHFKAIKFVAAPGGTTIMLDTKVTPYNTGEVEAQTGVYQDPVYAISSGWAGAILNVE